MEQGDSKNIEQGDNAPLTREADKALLNGILDKLHIELTPNEREVIFDIVYQGFKDLKPEEKTLEKFTSLTHSSIVFAKQITLGTACHYCAAIGHVNLIDYSHKRGCVWDTTTTREAAAHGQLEALKFLHENGCPWDGSLFGSAQFLKTLKADPLERRKCIAYALENGCPCALFE